MGAGVDHGVREHEAGEGEQRRTPPGRAGPDHDHDRRGRGRGHQQARAGPRRSRAPAGAGAGRRPGRPARRPRRRRPAVAGEPSVATTPASTTAAASARVSTGPIVPSHGIRRRTRATTDRPPRPAVRGAPPCRTRRVRHPTASRSRLSMRWPGRSTIGGVASVPLPPGVLAFAERGPDWAAFVERLPRLFREVTEEWGLAVDGEPTHGYCSLVVPVRRGERARGAQAGLPRRRGRARGARRCSGWGGDGAVRLLSADPHRSGAAARAAAPHRPRLAAGARGLRGGGRALRADPRAGAAAAAVGHGVPRPLDAAAARAAAGRADPAPAGRADAVAGRRPVRRTLDGRRHRA